MPMISTKLADWGIRVPGSSANMNELLHAAVAAACQICAALCARARARVCVCLCASVSLCLCLWCVVWCVYVCFSHVSTHTREAEAATLQQMPILGLD